MGDKARHTKARCEQLLRQIGQCCGHQVDAGQDAPRRVTVATVFHKWSARRSYCGVGEPVAELVRHDLGLLTEDDCIDFDMLIDKADSPGAKEVGPFESWSIWLRPEGLKRLVEIEKCWIIRAYEKNPPAWWLVFFTAASAGIATVALLKSYGII